MADVHHETIYFTGRVQGVGFRYLARQVASEYEVSGFVSNLADGRVQLEAEGSREEIEKVVKGIQERMHGYIRKVDRHADQREAQYKGFEIR